MSTVCATIVKLLHAIGQSTKRYKSEDKMAADLERNRIEISPEKFHNLFVEHYPDSFEGMKENTEYQERFK